jgi:hypothetical protein
MPFCCFHASLVWYQRVNGETEVSRAAPFLSCSVNFLSVTLRALHDTVNVALWYLLCIVSTMRRREGWRTHGLFVEAVELQSRRGGWFLRPRSDLVDCIERMAEDPICKVRELVSKCSTVHVRSRRYHLMSHRIPTYPRSRT